MSSLGNKQTMADNILYYMNINNKTRNDLCRDLGFKYTTLTGWLTDVAKIVGVTRQTIQKYESGIIPNIPSDKIELLASALETTPAYLMGWEDKQKEVSPVIGEDLSPSDKKLMEILPKLNEDQKKIGIALLEALLKNK